MAGTEVAFEWNGRPARAWVPDPLSSLPLDLSVDSARRTERAAAAVQRAARLVPASWEPLARLLLRAEGIASSSIEGIRAEAGAAANVATIVTALETTGTELTIDVLHGWHSLLMHDQAVVAGAFRTSQGWIGGRSPLDAAFVPPPAAEVPRLMDDLVAFANRDDVDPVTQAAVVHGQFETVHPYGDGNGRIGRVLVSWVLARRLHVAVPPPVSVHIARDPGGYLSGLYWFRTGELDRWVGWFAGVVETAGNAAIDWAGEIDAVMAEWRSRLADLRVDATARKVLDLLPAHPVVSAAIVAEEWGVSERSARDALAVLGARGVLEPHDMAATGPGRPRQWWIARALLELVGA